MDFSQQYMTSEAYMIAHDVIILNLSNSQLKGKYKEIALTHSISIIEEGNIFGKIRNDDFTFEKQDEEYILQIKGLNVESRTDNLDLKRFFDLDARFDKKGQRLT